MRRPQTKTRAFIRCGALATLLLAGGGVQLACGSSEPAAPATTPAEAPEAARAPAPAEAPAAAEGAAALTLPPPGQIQVRVGAEGTVALANQAPRRALLEAIARETGLVVVAFVAGGDPDGRVTVRSQGESIEVLLARALGGVPYSIEPLEPGARVSVVVGKRGGAARARPRIQAEPPRTPAARAERPVLPDEEALEQLTSSNPEERLEGVEWLDVTSATGYEAVVDRLANDPDPLVRAAAAESLGDADVGAVSPLIRALEDPDNRVVLGALEALELLGDSSTIPKLRPALEHPDREVRERALEVQEFLE